MTRADFTPQLRIDEPGIPGRPGSEPEPDILQLSIDMTSPRQGDRLDNTFAVTGTVSCRIINLGQPNDPGREAITRVQKVEIRLGNGSFVRATPTGSGGRWSSWRFNVNTSQFGSTQITARVTANDIGPVVRTITRSDSVTVTIADEVKPIARVSSVRDGVNPPYTAIIKGRASDVGSGLKRLQWRVDDGSLRSKTLSGSSQNWEIQQNLPGLGGYLVTIQAVDRENNVSAPVTTTVSAIDAEAPTLKVTTPPDDHKVLWSPEGTTANFEGTASDLQSGVQRVEWRLQGETSFKTATTTNDWQTWRFPVTFSDPGDAVVQIRAVDQFNNVSELINQTVIVAIEFDPVDPLDAVSPAVYLNALIDFTTHRIDTGTNPAERQAQLEQIFHQPFGHLLDQAFRTVANQPVSQVRVCVEVLRQQLAALGQSLLEATEQQYRLSTYRSLLNSFGVSDHELRLARVADQPTRENLAQRLGITLGEQRPDRLDQLVRSPEQLTEDQLQTLFGLANTTLSLAELITQPEPQLLLWQQETMRSRWQQQDANAGQPIIDPDWFIAADFQSEESAAFGLWQTRQQQVNEQLQALRAQQQAHTGTVLECFDQMVAEAIAPIKTLIELSEAYQTGDDIETALAEIPLAFKPFLVLMKLRELATADSILADEWETVFAIAIQVSKHRQYEIWFTEEQQAGLVVSPQVFRLADEVVSLPDYRATERDRQRWQATLAARIDQAQALEQSYAAALSAAEAATLPTLRDALIQAIDGDRPLAEAANQLSQTLLIDMQNGGELKTTRIELAIAAVQSLLFGVRTERFAADHPAADWQLSETNNYSETQFDEEMQWMGTYATWRAAMFVFGYPENYLLPNLRLANDQTEEFKTLVSRLRADSRLTPVRARELVAAYFLADKKPGEGFSPRRRIQDLLNQIDMDAVGADEFFPTDEVTEAQLIQRQDAFAQLFNKAEYARLKDVPNDVVEVGYAVPLLITSYLQRAGQYVAALDWLQTVYAYNLPADQRKIYAGLMLESQHPNNYSLELDWLLGEALADDDADRFSGLNPHIIAHDRDRAYTHHTLITLISCVLDFADAEFTRDSNEAITKARSLYLTALDLLNSADMQEAESPFPPNPVITGLRLHAENNLLKIRSGRNIAGLKRQATFEAANNSRFSGLATTNGEAIQLAPPPQPTPYRYPVLIARAKELVAIAQQIEATFFSVLQQQDAEAYNLLKARQDVQLSFAGVELQTLRVEETRKEVDLAILQQDQSQFRADHFDGLLNEGLNTKEKAAIGFMVGAAALQVSSAAISATGAIANAVLAVATFGLFGGQAAGSAAQAASSLAAAASTNATLLQTKASYERREQEWRFLRGLAEHDVRIGGQQIAIAQGHVALAQQERTISRLQSTQAEDTLAFLVTKFTNRELFDWMSQVLERVYSYFLQQATAMARLAEAQLAFERQETPPAFIQSDYWQVVEEDSINRDRRGLTGSVRLLQDLTKLDQFAFETNQRKLQLTQTFSLAEMSPIEFQRFRETGILPFQMPMALFDRDFPGHYLRLIKRVRVSVLALTPPTRGVRATLSASGLSRVVIGGNLFQSAIVRRSPELIAFTSPNNATGLFELEPEGDLLLPFEGMGVDTLWQLELPKAANPFDYASIADVLFTVEYTALNSLEYRQQVIDELDQGFSGDRGFSLRQQFADQWYALHNPDQSETPMTIQFETRREDFLPHVNDLKIQQLMLHLAMAADQEPLAVPVTLRFAPSGQTQSIEGSATPTDGTISTRRGNGSSLTPLIGQSPIGTWELSLPDTEAVRQTFEDEIVEDILLVITYQGESPAWQ